MWCWPCVLPSPAPQRGNCCRMSINCPWDAPSSRQTSTIQYTHGRLISAHEHSDGISSRAMSHFL
jgi:hypothetical protein